MHSNLTLDNFIEKMSPTDYIYIWQTMLKVIKLVKLFLQIERLNMQIDFKKGRQ